MADAVINILFQNLNAFLIQEASLLSGVDGDVEEIKMELDSMRSFLKDADRRKDGNEGLRTWVGQVRESAYNVEDIIDDFTYGMNRPQRGGCKRFLLQTIRLPKVIFRRHQLATQLQQVKSQIATISKRREQYQLSKTEDGSSSSNGTKRWRDRGEILLYMDDNEIVGLEKRVSELVQWLTGDDPRRAVVSIVGMGGLGKTTLVAQAFKNEIVKRHFDSFGWVSVSQCYNIEELLQKVVKDLFRENRAELSSVLHNMSGIQLLRFVHQYLAVKRYVIVIDDVWSLEAWRELNIAFPRNSCGSRIMLTTRHENVALGLGDASCTFRLEPLGEKEAWRLFCKHAFRKEPCPQELEPVGRRIFKKCEGLPLALVALGGLLSTREKSMAEWDKVYDNMSRQLSQNSELEPMKNIFLLSFYDLPHNLKHCFLYCCVFPEDYLFHRKRLIRLWVAEGFVEDEDGMTMEETAEDYMKQLVHRNMFQVIATNEFGRLQSFRVHDILREAALLVSKEEKFCMIYDGQQASPSEKFRRISIHTFKETSRFPMNMSQVRSLLVFDTSVSFSSSLNMMASSFKLLRVLQLEGVPIKKLPDELTNLFNLRYLDLRRTEVSELPKSLGKLQNMQTLDLRRTKVERLPSGIEKLQRLHHLFCSQVIDSEDESFHFRKGMKVPPRLCQITSLQSLVYIEAEGEIVGQIGNLTQLRTLGIAKVRAVDGVKLCASISRMKHLATLSIVSISEEEALELEAPSQSPPPRLRKLMLRGHLEKLPQWLGSLTNLTHLRLHWSCLREVKEGYEFLSMLQALPNLLFLHLRKTHEGQHLMFQDGWFPKLKELHLWDFSQLSRAVIEKGAMSSLQVLWLVDCKNLKTLPQGIEHLGDLQELILQEMPLEFVARLRPANGNEERQNVAHIPLIQHQWKTENGQWEVERLS